MRLSLEAAREVPSTCRNRGQLLIPDECVFEETQGPKELTTLFYGSKQSFFHYLCSQEKFTMASGSATNKTREILERHLDALLRGDIETVLSQYPDSSVMLTRGGSVRELEKLRAGFTSWVANTDGFPDSFERLTVKVEENVAYLVCKCEPAFSLGTDTFVVRDGKIAIQTFTVLDG